MNFSPLKMALRAKRRKNQRGYSLIETSLALSLAVMVTASGLGWLQYQQRLDQGEAAGQLYLSINQSVQSYMAGQYDELVKVPAHCSQPRFFDTNGDTRISFGELPDAAACTRSLKRADGVAYSVSNVLQPTLADLRALGYLSSTMRDTLPFPTALKVVQDVAGVKSLAASHFAVRIEQVCSANTTAQTTCPAKDLRSLLFNAQPYDDKVMGSGFMGALTLATAFAQIQGQGAMSPENGGDLLGWQGLFQITNPVRAFTATGNGLGSANILGIRGGYGSAGLMQFMRLDGSVKPTADWDFANHSIDNVGSMSANGSVSTGEAHVAGELKTQSAVVKDGALEVQDAGGNTVINLQSNGQLSAKTGTFSSAVSAASVNISGAVSSESAKVSSSLKASKTTIENALYLGPLKTVGSACDANTETLARQADADYSKGEGMLQCAPAPLKKWVSLRGATGATGPQGPAASTPTPTPPAPAALVCWRATVSPGNIPVCSPACMDGPQSRLEAVLGVQLLGVGSYRGFTWNGRSYSC